jgi:hypothetical protein
MPSAVSTTRWRDEAITPTDYADVASLVKVVRRARGRIVEFDWYFTRQDLQLLRRAVYEWGSPVRGVYRCFDARVLAEINRALAEPDSIFVLNEPKGYERLDCKPSCVPDGDRFRLHGHAPFDIVFGYGEAGVQEFRVFLGPTIQATLADSVGMLGWDLRRLQEPRFRPVRNALYGLPVGRNTTDMPPHPGPEVDVALTFQGPFAAVDDTDCRCLFRDPIADLGGVYLWTVNVDGAEWPWYVGQTRRGFGQRMAEHLSCFMSGQYTTYDAVALSHGEYRRAKGMVSGVWPQTVPSFLQSYENLVPHIISLIRMLRFHVAVLDENEHRLNQIEGAIGRYYKAHPRPELRNFFTPGLKIPAAIPGDQPLRLTLTCEFPITGLPSELRD